MMPAWLSGTEFERRVQSALEAVLPPNVALVEHASGADTGVDFILAGQLVTAKWVDGTDLSRVRTVIMQSKPRPNLLIAAKMSPASRKLASSEGIGWVDESGDAEFAIGSVVVARTGADAGGVRRDYGQSGRWTAAATAAAEALLTGVPATVEALSSRAGIPSSTAALTLKFLERMQLLEGGASRGRKSGRVIRDRDALLSAYSAAVTATAPKAALRVAVLWRDPVAAVADLGRSLDQVNMAWAVTGALTAAIRAPYATQVAPLVIYLDVHGLGELRSTAKKVQLTPEPAGRLTFATFPSRTTLALSEPVGDGVRSVSWPRAYADLTSTGVRGEESAEHLRETVGNL
jgi:hypothetical protein